MLEFDCFLAHDVLDVIVVKLESTTSDSSESIKCDL